MSMDAGNWAEIFRAGRKNLPADHASPIVALGRALLAMEDKALEIGARHGEAPPTYGPVTGVTETVDPLRHWKVDKDGEVIGQWVSPLDYEYTAYYARDVARSYPGSKIFYRDNTMPEGKWGAWAEYNAAPYYPPDHKPS